MAPEPEIIEFASREAMAARLADLIEFALSSADIGRLAVSGGSTPEDLYRELASRPLPWPQIEITLVDERWVGADHPRSNEAFIRNAFAKADGVQIKGLYNGAPTPGDGELAIAEALEARKAPFHIVVLGMGPDGHTASWFPHAQGLDQALGTDRPVCAVTAQRSDVTGEETERMTLTLSAVRSADLIVLMMTGDDKRAAFQKALEEGPVEDAPVRAILRARPDLWVCWSP